MSLTNRLLLFFLGALALVLVGFSLTLYFLASIYLHRQADERLAAAANILVAAVGIDTDGLEWEPGERTLPPDEGPLGGQIVWRVSDEWGQVVDRSVGAVADGLLAEAAHHSPITTHNSLLTWEGQLWMIYQRWLRPSATGATKKPALQSHSSPHAPREESRHAERDGDVGGVEGKKYSALTITVAAPLGPLRAALRTSAIVLTCLALAVWLSALVGGRWVCRRALTPVTRMAASAREMNAAELVDRLPAPNTGDELDDLSRAFNGLLDRLQESFDRQRRFTGDASHQLRTPLTAMLGQIEVALRRERSVEEYQRTLDSVHRQASHLRRFIEALLFLARADAEARLPDLEPVDLEEWLPRHLSTFSSGPRGTDLRTEIVADGSYQIEAQPPLLAELVNNLLDNAMKYSPPGTPVTVRLGRESAAVTLSVEDHGCGISEEELPLLFDPFFRSPAARRHGVAGVGLGLAVANRIAVAFGGRIEVTSLVGLGSCFTVRFPSLGSERCAV